MNRSANLNNNVQVWRILVFGIAIAAVFVIYLGRLFSLQILQSSEWVPPAHAAHAACAAHAAHPSHASAPLPTVVMLFPYDSLTSRYGTLLARPFEGRDSQAGARSFQRSIRGAAPYCRLERARLVRCT